MERTKRNNDEKTAPIISDFLRVGMWPISETTEPNVEKRIYRYGTGTGAGVIVVDGKLSEHDRGAFLIVRAMDKSKGYAGIHGKISDLVKRKDIKNPYQSGSILKMWNSVEALLDVHVRIKPNKLGGSLSVAFKLVAGWIDSDGSYFLTTHDYQKIVESLSLHEINIPLKDYFSSRSPITRSLKEFLRTQSLPYSKGGYEISLLKLCKYIGYDTGNKGFWQIWPHIEKAMNELKQTGFLEKCSTRDLLRCKQEGGVIRFWRGRKQEKLNEEFKNEIDFNEILELFPDDFQNDGLFQKQLQAWIEWKPGITIIQWKAIAREWSNHSVIEVNFQINHAIAKNWKGVFFIEKKELKCPYGMVFGKDFNSSRTGCTDPDYCKIQDQCNAGRRKLGNKPEKMIEYGEWYYLKEDGKYYNNDGNLLM